MSRLSGKGGNERSAPDVCLYSDSLLQTSSDPIFFCLLLYFKAATEPLQLIPERSGRSTSCFFFLSEDWFSLLVRHHQARFLARIVALDVKWNRTILSHIPELRIEPTFGWPLLEH